jgi:N-acetylmuramic acid 6-phosphate etherase
LKNRKSYNNKKPLAPRGRQVFDELQSLVTEKINPRSKNIDRLSVPQILRLINREDATVADAVRRELPFIARAVQMTIAALTKDGRLFYLGAGTSGRLGVLDAAECPPTFGTDPKQIRGIIAGGLSSLVRSREGVEDDIKAAKGDIKKSKIGARDLVIGISASKRTPYVLEGLRQAHRQGAQTIFICCNPRKMVAKEFDLSICPVVGPEIIAGSSRMKAGTAQKMILNMITTAAMIRTGRVYGNRMVDLRAASEKLKERSKKVLMDTCKLEYDKAAKLLKRSGGSVKTAIVMEKTKSSKSEAEKLLKLSDGFVRTAIEIAHKKNIPAKRKQKLP